MSGECIIDVNRSIVLRLADIRGHVDLVLLQRPWWRTSGPKNTGSRSVGLGGDAEGSRGVVIIPGVSSNENVRRVRGHGRDLGVVRSRDQSSSEWNFDRIKSGRKLQL